MELPPLNVLEVKCVLKRGIAGCASLSNLCGASETDQGEQLKCDLFLVKNDHPLLDLLILTQTVEVFFFRAWCTQAAC
jgi:lipopolysaccharide/colanic/teichoic acid biosynthesis glycosyltransferase